MYGFRDIFVFAMYYIYGTSEPSLLTESTDSMILKPFFETLKNQAFICPSGSMLTMISSEFLHINQKIVVETCDSSLLQ